MAKLSEILKRQRAVLRLSPEYIATQIGKGARMYHKYESGENEPGLEALLQLSEILKFELNELQEDFQTEEPQEEYKKAPTLKDVDAFLASNQVRQVAMLQVILSAVAELLAHQRQIPVQSALDSLTTAVRDKEAALREAVEQNAS